VCVCLVVSLSLSRSLSLRTLVKMLSVVLRKLQLVPILLQFMYSRCLLLWKARVCRRVLFSVCVRARGGYC
jgi:hypothetical protein